MDQGNSQQESPTLQESPPLVPPDFETRGLSCRQNLRIFDRNPFRNGVFKCKTDEEVPKIFSRCARLSNNMILVVRILEKA